MKPETSLQLQHDQGIHFISGHFPMKDQIIITELIAIRKINLK